MTPFPLPDTSLPALPALLNGNLWQSWVEEGRVFPVPDLHRAIHTATMEADLAAMPDGLETMVGPRGVRLSGGQVQRSAAARMLAREPQLLVFDDLSSALDVDTEQLLWDRLFASTSDVTALVVSHRRPALQRADHVLVMRDGHIEAAGTADELLESSQEFRRLWSGDYGSA